MCVNCGSEAFDKEAFKKLSLTYQTVFPACVVCKADGKKETCLGKRQKTTQQRTTIQVQDLSTDGVSTPAILFEVSSTKMKRQLSMKDFVTTEAKKNRKINDQQAEQQQEKADETHDDMIDQDAEQQQEKADKTHDDMIDQDAEQQQKKADETNDCALCHQEEPVGRSKYVTWVDCDNCGKWAHLYCAKRADWLNIRKNSWLCLEHK